MSGLGLRPEGPTVSARLRRVAIYGTFDVLNYGDLLFPHLMRHGLGPGSEIACFSPRGGQPAWADACPTQPVGAAPQWRPDLHVIGGGNIISARGTPLGDYRESAFGSHAAYASLWLGAGLIAAEAGGRLAWNAPGVPAAIEPEKVRRLRDMIVAASDYVAVRDQPSREYLGAGDDVAVVPDTALDVARLWPAPTLAGPARDAFLRRGGAAPERWLVFHPNARYLDADVAQPAAAIDAICGRAGATAVLIAIGLCHGDAATVREIGSRLRRTALIVDQPEGLTEIAGLIAHSAGYVGSSLHGLITALAYRRPAIAVGQRSMVKFGGFLEQLNMAHRLVSSWEDAMQTAAQALLPLPPEANDAISSAQEKVAQHWNRMRLLLAGGHRVAVDQARARLQTWMREAPPKYRGWRAFELVLAGAASGPQQAAPEVPKPGARCNICQGAIFKPGPRLTPDLVGYGAVCTGCGAPARTRAMRVLAAAMLSAEHRRGACLRFGRTRAVAREWFKAVEDVASTDISDAFEPDAAERAVDVIACADVLERAADPIAAVRRLLRGLRKGGLMFLALRTVPGRPTTLDWGFPRGDREGEWRAFGEDFAEILKEQLSDAAVAVASPADPVTDVATIVYVLAREARDLGRLRTSGINHQLLTLPPERPEPEPDRQESDMNPGLVSNTLEDAILEIELTLSGPLPAEIAARIARLKPE